MQPEISAELSIKYDKLEKLILSRKTKGDSKTDYNFFDINDRTLLHYAVELNDTQKISFLLEQKVDINIKTKRTDQTPIELALSVGNLQAAQQLFDQGADCYSVKLADVTNQACRNWVISHIRDELDEKTIKKRFIKSTQGNTDIKKLTFLQRCAEVDDINKIRQFKDKNILKELMTHNSERSDGIQPDSLQTIASANGSMNVLRELMYQFSPQLFVTTPLQAAINANQIAAFNYLIKLKQQPNFSGHNKETALVTAVRSQRAEMVTVLLQQDEWIGCTDMHGRNAFHWACLIGNLEILKQLLKRFDKVYSDHKDIYGKTALDYAIHFGHDEIIKFLTSAENFEEIKKDHNYKQKPNLIAQDIILFKMFYYLQLLSRDLTGWSMIQGHCNGFEILSELYSDEYYISTLKLISNWDGSENALEEKFPKIPQADFYKNLHELLEQWINDVVWFQHEFEVASSTYREQKERHKLYDMVRSSSMDYHMYSIPRASYSVSQAIEMMSLLWKRPLGTVLKCSAAQHTTRARLNTHNEVSYYDSNFYYATTPVDRPGELFLQLFNFMYLNAASKQTTPQKIDITFTFSKLDELSPDDLQEWNNRISVYQLPSSIEEAKAQQDLSPNKFTLAHIAVLIRNIDLLQRVIACESIDINAEDAHQNSALKLALQTDSDQCVNILLQQASKLVIEKELVHVYQEMKYTYFETLFNHPLTKNFTELMQIAIKRKDFNLVKKIVETNKISKAELESRPQLLLTALQENDRTIFLYLLQNGANLYGTVSFDSYQITPLQLLSDKFQFYQSAVSNLTEIDKKDELGNTLLHFAVRSLSIPDKLALTRDLLSKNVDPLVVDAQGKTPLMLFVMNNSIKFRPFDGFDEIINQLAPSIHIQDINGNTALHLVDLREFKLISILIEKGANANIKNKDGESFLLIVLRSFLSMKDKNEIIELCRNKGYLNKISSDEPELLCRLLHYAMDNNDLTLFKSLLFHATKNVINYEINGVPDLLEKAINTQGEIRELLEKKIAGINQKIAEPQTRSTDLIGNKDVQNRTYK